jgi:hypothetical protein
MHTGPVPGFLLNKKGGRKFNLLLNKRWNLLPSFLSNALGDREEGGGATHSRRRIF